MSVGSNCLVPVIDFKTPPIRSSPIAGAKAAMRLLLYGDVRWPHRPPLRLLLASAANPHDGGLRAAPFNRAQTMGTHIEQGRIPHAIGRVRGCGTDQWVDGKAASIEGALARISTESGMLASFVRVFASRPPRKAGVAANRPRRSTPSLAAHSTPSFAHTHTQHRRNHAKTPGPAPLLHGAGLRGRRLLLPRPGPQPRPARCQPPGAFLGSWAGAAAACGDPAHGRAQHDGGRRRQEEGARPRWRRVRSHVCLLLVH